MRNTKRSFNCPAELTLSLIDGRWRAILLYNLRGGPMRFGELRRRSPGITAATLANQLRDLEVAGFIDKAMIGRDRLDGVEYQLTPRGQSLRPVINALIRWGLEYRREYASGEFGMAAFQK